MLIGNLSVGFLKRKADLSAFVVRASLLFAFALLWSLQ